MRVLADLDVYGKRVFVRGDLDVPVGNKKQETGNRKQAFELSQEAEIATRLTNLKETVDYLVSKNAKSVIIAGHIDRPSGRDPALSTKQLLPILEKILGRSINFMEDFSGPVSSFPPASARSSQKSKVDQVDNVELRPVGNPSTAATPKISLLENLRFWLGETKNDQSFARELANLADVYVNEAFGNSHRNHASMVELPAILPHAAGLHLAKEVAELSKILQGPNKPFIAIVGGAKIETKLPLVEHLAKIADSVVVGGELPIEIAQSSSIFSRNVLVAALTDNQKDISNGSMIRIIELVKKAKTVVWNGPMGVFEEGYDAGTKAVAEAIIASGAHSVVGGGETVEFLAKNNFLSGPAGGFAFVSSGGGAMLEFLSGHKLPALAALE